MQHRAVVLAAVLLATPATAQTDTSELTGRELYELCARNDDFCVGFIAGAVSTTQAWSLSGGLPTVPFCLPGGTTYEQLAQAYLAWGEQNPDRLDDVATVVVHEAIAAAAPCGGAVLGSTAPLATR
jgi:hypothetical protein